MTPWLHLDLASVALLGLLAATIAGSFDGPALQALDWGMLLVFGAVLSLARLATSLGVDTLAGALIQQLLGDRRPGPLGLVLAVAVVSLVIRLALETAGYMVARSASENRLFTHEQAQRFALAYAALTLLGLALAVLYWRLLGIL